MILVRSENTENSPGEKMVNENAYTFKRIALIGAIANPNVGDDAILDVQLLNIRKMYGENCKVYVFSKDPSYTVRFYSAGRLEVIPVDYLHRITVRCNYAYWKILEETQTLLEGGGEEPLEYKILHDIFREIDILHIIGGGYLNSKWPDMVMEVYTAVKMASLYQKKILMTGNSLLPADEIIKPYIYEILGCIDIADFRDKSYEVYDLTLGGKYIETTDDAVRYKGGFPAASGQRGRYANFVLHQFEDDQAVLEEKRDTVFVPFIQKLLNDQTVDFINLLAFSEGDLKIWQNVLQEETDEGRVKRIDLINIPTYQAKQIVADAVFNVGSRYHQAVFSLSENVPVFSIFDDEYYENKIQTIHAVFGSKQYCRLEDCEMERLSEFVQSLEALREILEKNEENVTEIYQKKNWIIAMAYSENKEEADLLYRRLNQEDTPKVSVIIPIYNMEKYLQECLNSVSGQSLRELEIICVNDGSKDRSAEILSENARKDPRIKVISQINQGVAAARNNGLKAASGEYVFFIDPDDWLQDENVLRILYDAAKNNHVMMSGGEFAEYNVNWDKPVTEWMGRLAGYTFPREGLITSRELQFDYGWIRFLYNRRFLIRNDFWFPKRTFFEDPVWFVRVLDKAETFYAVKRTVYCYRTGFKSYDLPYGKVVDLLRGLGDNIEFAKEKGYDMLLDLEVARLTQDYAENIARCMRTSYSSQIDAEIVRINRVLYPNGEKNICCEILFTYYENSERRISEIREERDQLKNRITDIFNSLTWKIGNVILWLPKTIMRKIRHEV